jgi:hypothetical protein
MNTVNGEIHVDESRPTHDIVVAEWLALNQRFMGSNPGEGMAWYL